MDVWSDPNLAAFMGVTAHWLVIKEQSAIPGPVKKLVLRSELIGFQYIPGSHTGVHLAHALLKVIDRIQATTKVILVFVLYIIIINLYLYIISLAGLHWIMYPIIQLVCQS